MVDAPITVVVIDEDWLSLDGVVAALDRTPGMQVVGRAGTAEQGLALIRTLRPAVALIDLVYDRAAMQGLELTRWARTSAPGTAIAVFTAGQAEDGPVELLAAGAARFLIKGETDVDDLRDAVRRAARGEVVFSREHANRIAQRLQTAREAADPWFRFGLTNREKDVLRLLSEGCSNAEISERLVLSIQAVKNYVAQVCRKLCARNRTHAAVIALNAHRNDSVEETYASVR
jgi:DNA-binding NarL/FixJ family response regulator